MGWTRNDDRMPFHRKWLSLSNDAYAMGHRAITWARSPEAHARPGFVTERELRALSGGLRGKRFVAALAELVNAGAPAHERGILEPTDGGYLVHDFDHYGPREQAPSPRSTAPDARPKMTQAESARLAGQKSAQVRRERNGTAQPSSRTSSNAPPNVTERQRSERRSNDTDQPVNFVPVSPDPDPERTITIVQDTEAVPLERRSAPAVVVGIRNDREPELSECPPDLYEQAEGGGVLTMLAHELGANLWDVQHEACGFVRYWRIGKGMRGRKRDWMAELRQRIVQRHDAGELAGCGEPPGAAEHAARTGRHRQQLETPGAGRAQFGPVSAARQGTPSPVGAEFDAMLEELGHVRAAGAAE